MCVYLLTSPFLQHKISLVFNRFVNNIASRGVYEGVDTAMLLSAISFIFKILFPVNEPSRKTELWSLGNPLLRKHTADSTVLI